MTLFKSVHGIVNELTFKLRAEYEFIIIFWIDNVLYIKLTQKWLYTVILGFNNTTCSASFWVSPK